MWPFTTQHTKDLEGRLRRSGQAVLSANAKDRMSKVILAEFDRVTPTAAPRLSNQPMTLQHKLRPMFIPIALIVLIGAGFGTISAADAAKPGDALFGLDRAVEKVRLAVAVRESSKAKLAAEIAQEREQELQRLLATKRSDDAAEAKALANAAVDRALDVLAVADSNVSDDDRAKVINQLEPIQESLRDLVDDSDDLVDPSVPVSSNEIEVHISASVATISIELNDRHDEFQLQTSDQKTIIDEISRRTGLETERIRALTKFEIDGQVEPSNANANLNINQNSDDDTDDSDSSTEANANTNHAGNTNTSSESNENANANASDDSDTESPAWQIEVRVKESEAEIKTEYGETIRLEWTLASADESVILDSITEKTGLTREVIRSLWHFETE